MMPIKKELDSILNLEDDAYKEEYNRYLKGFLSNQLKISDIRNMLDEETIKKVEEKINIIHQEQLYTGKLLHPSTHIENVILFSAIIGKNLSLNEKDLDLLLTASLYHDIGRKSDHYEKYHGQISSVIVGEKLKNDYEKTELAIVRAMISYHNEHEMRDVEGNYDLTKLIEICNDMGIDVKNEELMKRIVRLSFALKDADALDRTRFSVTSPNAFVDVARLHFPISKRLIMFSEQVNEYYASLQIQKEREENPNSSPIFSNIKGTPKQILSGYLSLSYSKTQKDKIKVIDNFN